MAAVLAGTWKLDRSENFDNYLSELGVGLVKRKTAGTLSQHVVITVDGDHINIKTTTTLSKQENDFTLGKKYMTPAFGLAGGDYEALATFEGGKLSVHAEPVSTSLKATDIAREIVGDELVMTMVCGSVTCKRFFKKE